MNAVIAFARQRVLMLLRFMLGVGELPQAH
jgi:hypothetical protein